MSTGWGSNQAQNEKENPWQAESGSTEVKQTQESWGESGQQGQTDWGESGQQETGNQDPQQQEQQNKYQQHSNQGFQQQQSGGRFQRRSQWNQGNNRGGERNEQRGGRGRRGGRMMRNEGNQNFGWSKGQNQNQESQSFGWQQKQQFSNKSEQNPSNQEWGWSGQEQRYEKKDNSHQNKQNQEQQGEWPAEQNYEQQRGGGGGFRQRKPRVQGQQQQNHQQYQQKEQGDFGWSKKDQQGQNHSNWRGRIISRGRSRGQKGGGHLIHNPEKFMKIYNPIEQTWVDQKFEILEDEVLIETNDPSKDFFTSMKEWNDLGLIETLLENVINYQDLALNKKVMMTRPSKIQSYAIPLIISDPPENLIAQAHTGTGKTIAFCLGSLCRVDAELQALQVICIANTRELVQQIHGVFLSLSKNTGVKTSIMLSQKECPKEIGHILIATPGTLLAQIKRNQIDISNTRVFVVDEADIMFETVTSNLGNTTFEIIKQFPAECQMICFSATYPDSVLQIIDEKIKDANKIQIAKEQLTLDGIRQIYIRCLQEKKIETLANIFKECEVGQVLTFVNSKLYAEKIVDQLRNIGHNVSILIGDMSPQERDSAIMDFREFKSRVLISTNLISRGLDVTTISLVVNFDIPIFTDPQNSKVKKVDCTTYLHRIGRTGRFSRKGIALNIVTDEERMNQLNEIQEFYQTQIQEIKSLSEIGTILDQMKGKETEGAPLEEEKKEEGQ